MKSQKDLTDDIDKAYNLFVDEEKGLITFASLKREVEDLISEELGKSFFNLNPFFFLNLFFLKQEEPMTDQQIWQLILGANNKDLDTVEEKEEKKPEGGMKKASDVKEPQEMTVDKEKFIRILSRDLNEEKKK